MPPRSKNTSKSGYRPNARGSQEDRLTSKRVLWTKDAVAGGMSSLDVVISWMTTETNYNRWKGGDKYSGTTKAGLASEIVGKLHTNGIHHRTTKDIVQKVGDIERSYRTACDWLANTGQGVVWMLAQEGKGVLNVLAF
ncbi:Aste57867_6580 [Aphanomyces stellatus]|uniref:Aste57867_6580 protein n=1 Tax=Aphanomyces stellatus TaxID=120398 RepID=A0A485KFV8_9STRA|nr:hypothetical protein As57867_006563 [Aphanomyces stellatus]VFT83561.1 Aste57867_6580 [Aphanomyces stellatus]